MKAILVALIVGLGVGLLSACGDTQPADLVAPTKACPVQKAHGLVGSDNPPKYILGDVSSDAERSYCLNVVQDYQRFVDWYKNQVKNNSYTSTMLDEYSNYYTGDLLQNARNSLYYNQQAGRVVMAKWDEPDNYEQEWASDGLSSTLSYVPNNYLWLSFPANHLEEAITYKGNPYQSWRITLVYDAKAAHWKIKSTSTEFIQP